MKNNKSSRSRARYDFLRSYWANAPLIKSELEELKTLAKKFNPKLAKYMEENPEIC
jgi:hypothetical protein